MSKVVSITIFSFSFIFFAGHLLAITQISFLLDGAPPTDDSDDELVPYDEPLYQNQEADPEVQKLIWQSLFEA